MYRILLVDDDQNIVDGLGSIIKQNFENIFVISSACDGSDALNRLTEDYYHVIISDIRMPKLDGISLLELISKNQIPSVVIMLSGYDDYTYIRNALRLGAYDYLLKPVESELFFQSLDKAYRSFSQIMQATVAIKTTDSIRMIHITDIRYAERIDKHIDYHLTDNTVIHSTSFNGSFQNAVAGLLAHKRMLLVGSSFVVNLFHVTEVTRSDLLLTGNLHVPVPRRMYDTVKREWADFWLNGGRYYAF